MNCWSDSGKSYSSRLVISELISGSIFEVGTDSTFSFSGSGIGSVTTMTFGTTPFSNCTTLSSSLSNLIGDEPSSGWMMQTKQNDSSYPDSTF